MSFCCPTSECRATVNPQIFSNPHDGDPLMHIEADLDDIHSERLLQWQQHLNKPLTEVVADMLARALDETPVNMSTPDRLYKYQSLSAYSLAALTNKTVWLAKPKTFNDPYDCALTLDRKKYKESIMHAISILIEKAKPEGLKPEHQEIWPGDQEAFETHRDSLRNLLQEIGICSLSAVPNHLLMWSHYANHHRGFCVEYDCHEGTQLRTLAHRVRYEDKMPSISVADISGPKKEEVLDSLWLTKAKCWSYEEEWRLMDLEGNKSVKAPSDVLSVIFGAKMPESDRIMIAQSLRHEPNVKFKETILQEDQFILEIVDYIIEKP